MPDPKLDVTRLAALVADRTRKRALTRDASDRYQQVREARMDLQRRMSMLSTTALAGGSTFAAQGADQVGDLQKEYDRLTGAMDRLQAEMDGYSAEAAAAAALVKSCAAFAIHHGLPVSEELRREVDPSFLVGAA